jgi:hypothetical protein
MPWNTVTIPRRGFKVGIPERCVYCFHSADLDLPLRARRVQSSKKGQLTITQMVEHLEIDIPYCRSDANRSVRTRKQIRTLGFGAAAAGILLGLLAVVTSPLDAPLGVRIIFGVLVGFALGVLALLGAGIAVRKLPAYRDWGAGMLGVDLIAGPEALTFRFTNPTYAATFRTRNGMGSR